MDKSLPQWKSYGAYSSAELRALRFRTLKDRDLAIDAMFDNPDLRGVPCVSPDGRTLVVPEEAVQYFRDSRARFRVNEVTRLSDLSTKEYAEMRRKYDR